MATLKQHIDDGAQASNYWDNRNSQENNGAVSNATEEAVTEKKKKWFGTFLKNAWSAIKGTTPLEAKMNFGDNDPYVEGNETDLTPSGRFVGLKPIENRFRHGNEAGTASSNEVFLDGFEDPTHLTFKIEFGEWGACVNDDAIIASAQNSQLNNNTMFMDYDVFPMGLLDLNFEGDSDVNSDFNSTTTYNAHNWLRSRNEDRRAQYIHEFVKGIYAIQRDMPYLFQKISGLDKLSEFDSGRGQRLKDCVIHLSCLSDGIDQKMRTLLEMYRKAAWNDVWQRWELPDIYRYFKMIIYVFDNRCLQMGGGQMSPDMEDFPIMALECGPCEFVIKNENQTEYSQNYFDAKNTEPTIDIKVLNVNTYYQNKLFQHVKYINDIKTVDDHNESNDNGVTFSNGQEINWRYVWMTREFMLPDEYTAYEHAYNPTGLTHYFSDQGDYANFPLNGPGLENYIPEDDWHFATVSDQGYVINSWSSLWESVKSIVTSNTTLIRDSRWANKYYFKNDLMRLIYTDLPRFGNMIEIDTKKAKKDMLVHIKNLQEKCKQTLIIKNTTKKSTVDSSSLVSLDSSAMKVFYPINKNLDKKTTVDSSTLTGSKPKPQKFYPLLLNKKKPSQKLTKLTLNLAKLKQVLEKLLKNLDKPDQDLINTLLDLHKPNQKMIDVSLNLGKIKQDLTPLELNQSKPVAPMIDVSLNLSKPEQTLTSLFLNLLKNNPDLQKLELNLDKIKQELIYQIQNLDVTEQEMKYLLLNVDKIAQQMISLELNLEKLGQDLIQLALNLMKPNQDLVEIYKNLEKLQQELIMLMLNLDKPDEDMIPLLLNLKKFPMTLQELIMYLDKQMEDLYELILNTDKPEQSMEELMLNLSKATQDLIEIVLELSKPESDMISMELNTNKDEQKMLESIKNLQKVNQELIAQETNIEKPSEEMQSIIADLTKVDSELSQMIFNLEHKEQDYQNMIINDSTDSQKMKNIDETTGLPEQMLNTLDLNLSTREQELVNTEFNTEHSDMKLQTLEETEKSDDMEFVNPELNLNRDSIDMNKLIINDTENDMELQRLESSEHNSELRDIQLIKNTEHKAPEMDSILLNLDKSDEISNGIIINDSSSDMKFTDINGNVIKLSELKGGEIDINDSLQEMKLQNVLKNMSKTDKLDGGDIMINTEHPDMELKQTEQNLEKLSELKGGELELNTKQTDMKFTEQKINTEHSTSEITDKLIINDAQSDMKFTEQKLNLEHQTELVADKLIQSEHNQSLKDIELTKSGTSLIEHEPVAMTEIEQTERIFDDEELIKKLKNITLIDIDKLQKSASIEDMNILIGYMEQTIKEAKSSLSDYEIQHMESDDDRDRMKMMNSMVQMVGYEDRHIFGTDTKIVTADDSFDRAIQTQRNAQQRMKIANQLNKNS